MYTKIMVPLDGSELAECVLPHVEKFIEGCQVSTIVLVQAIEPISVGAADIRNAGSYEGLREQSERIEAERKLSVEKYLTDVANRFKTDKVDIQTKVLLGRVADILVHYSETEQIDLILMATHGRSGISRWVRGSVADRILRASRVPVLLVRAPGSMKGLKD